MNFSLRNIKLNNENRQLSSKFENYERTLEKNISMALEERV